MIKVNMILYVISTLFISNVFAETMYDKKLIESKSFLMEVANNLNKDLPIMLNKHSRHDFVLVEEKKLIFIITLLELNEKKYSQIFLNNTKKNKVLKEICNGSKHKIFPMHGVTIMYKYF